MLSRRLEGGWLVGVTEMGVTLVFSEMSVAAKGASLEGMLEGGWIVGVTEMGVTPVFWKMDVAAMGASL